MPEIAGAVSVLADSGFVRISASPSGKVLSAYQWLAHPTIVVSLASEDPKDGEAVRRLLCVQAGG